MDSTAGRRRGWSARAWFEWHGGAYSLDYFASLPSYQSGDAMGFVRFVQDLTDRWPGGTV